MTILSNSRRFIFVHLQKCGGSSLEVAYEGYQRWNDLILGSTPIGEQLQHLYRQQFGLHKHSTADEIRQVVGPEIWSGYRTIAFVRRPEKIYESYYKWALRLITGHLAESPLSWSELRSHLEQAPEEVEWEPLRWGHLRECVLARDFSDYAHRLMEIGLLARWTTQLSDSQGSILCDHVLQLEQREPIDGLFRELLEDPEFELPHINQGAALDEGELDWGDEVLRRFVELHEQEYRELGYEPPC